MMKRGESRVEKPESLEIMESKCTKKKDKKNKIIEFDLISIDLAEK